MDGRDLNVADKETLDRVAAVLNNPDTGLSAIKQAILEGSSTTTTYIKNPPVGISTTGTQVSQSTLPYNFYHGGAVVYKGEIHILGGYQMSPYTQHYKWNGTEWVSVGILPYAFYQGSALIYHDEIHILGGGTSTTRYYHYKYDGTSWTSISTLPYEFYYGSAIVYEDEIHLLGGGVDPQTQHYKWDGIEWTEVSTLPYAFCRGAATIYNDYIHILGGVSTDVTMQHYSWSGYDYGWLNVSVLPYPFTHGGVVISENNLHIFGSTVHGYYTLHYTWDDVTWEEVYNLPYPFYNGSVILYENEIHILGSGNGGTYQTNHYTIYSDYVEGCSTVTLDVGDVIYCDTSIVYPYDIDICTESNEGWICTTSGTCRFIINDNPYVILAA